MPVDARKAVSVIEKKHLFSAQINEQAGESSVELLEEANSLRFVPVDKVASRFVSLFFAPRKFLSGKYEKHVAGIVPNRPGCCGRVLVYSPAGRRTSAMLSVCAGHVKRFVPHDVDHAADQVGAIGRGANESSDSGHVPRAAQGSPCKVTSGFVEPRHQARNAVSLA